MVNMQKGYSLIELTIVVGLVAILGVGISSVVLMSLVTTNRTRNLTHVRETSDYAILQIKQQVRNARSIVSCTGNSLTLIGQDGGITTFSLETVGSYERIASNSGIYLTPSDIDIENFSLTCLPDETEPELVKLSFETQLASEGLRESENPLTNFETSITLRNN